jgi:hypothetical protein
VNVLEKMIKRNEGILKAMAEHPDPRMLRSTPMIAELENDGYREMLEMWQTGKPLLPHYPSLGLAGAMGSIKAIYEDFIVTNPDPEDAKRWRQAAREMGMPGYTCEYFFLPTAAVKLGDFPPPGIGVVAPEGICHLMPYHQKVFFEHNAGDLPTFEIDLPREYSLEAIEYMSAQLTELVKFTEEHVPSLKYDLDLHKQIIEDQRIWSQYATREWELKKNIPLPMGNMESCLPPFHIAPCFVGKTEKILEFWRMRVEELEERVAKGVDKKEELRILWVMPMPRYAEETVFPLMEELGVSVPALIFPTWFYWYGNRTLWGNDEEFGRKLTPIEEEARGAIYCGSATGSLKMAKDVIWMCQDLKCDAIICQQTCLHFGSSAKLIADKAEKELGVPTLILCTDFLDPAAMPLPEYVSRIKEFVDIAKNRKQGR